MKRSLDPYGAIDRQRQPDGYVEHLEARGRTPSQTRLRRRFLRFAQLRRGQRVLEVGSGTGIVSRDAAALLGPRGQVIAVDPSRVMTRAARRLARAGGFGSRLVHTVGDGVRPIPYGCFLVGLPNRRRLISLFFSASLTCVGS